MQFFGFNTGSGIYNWYSLDSVNKISKTSNSSLIVSFSSGESLKIEGSTIADQDIEKLTTSIEKIITVECESVTPIKTPIIF